MSMMKIGDASFNEAMEVISKSPSRVKLSINEPIDNNYHSVYPILLHQACPALVKNLLEAGFMVGICEKGAYIDKI